jgi:hypothetical protein
MDEWGIGKAFQCKPADCGTELTVTADIPDRQLGAKKRHRANGAGHTAANGRIFDSR